MQARRTMRKRASNVFGPGLDLRLTLALSSRLFA
jgi:hypothetical protein